MGGYGAYTESEGWVFRDPLEYSHQGNLFNASSLRTGLIWIHQRNVSWKRHLWESAEGEFLPKNSRAITWALEPPWFHFKLRGITVIRKPFCMLGIYPTKRKEEAQLGISYENMYLDKQKSLIWWNQRSGFLLCNQVGEKSMMTESWLMRKNHFHARDRTM